MDSQRNIITRAVAAVFFLGIAFGAGYAFHAHQENQYSNVRDDFSILLGGEVARDDIDLVSFWKVWVAINDKYVTSEMPSDNEKMYGAMGGLVKSLEDPYSIFLPPVEAKIFEEDVQGNFSGVGMEVGIRDDLITVIALIIMII